MNLTLDSLPLRLELWSAGPWPGCSSTSKHTCHRAQSRKRPWSAREYRGAHIDSGRVARCAHAGVALLPCAHVRVMPMRVCPHQRVAV